MAITPLTSRPPTRRKLQPKPTPAPRRPKPVEAPRRMASNFLSLSAAEVACRATSVLVTLSLAKVLGKGGYGRIEFAFNVVFWLVLLVRNGCEVIAARELARHPRLVRPLVNHLLTIKIVLATILFVGLVIVGSTTLRDPADRLLLTLYGLMLLTTAMGLDFVYRGMERMGLVAVSLYIRTAVYALGVWFLVGDASRIARVPAWLVTGEVCGIALVWGCYARQYGLPRPALSGRFLGVFLHRCRPVLMIQVAQTVLSSVDLMVVGLMCTWENVGLYGAPHRMVTAALTFGMIFQQVVFPTLARSWRDTPAAGRRALDSLVRILTLALIPVAVGASVLSGPLVHELLPEWGSGASWLLALGIWRAPLLTLAFLYQTALIAMNRESAGVRLLAAGALGSGPLAALLLWKFGLMGAAAAIVLLALALVIAGYGCLAREGRPPAWHHHLARPIAASVVMVPVCLVLLRWHLLAAILGGALSYAIALVTLGGFRFSELRVALGRD
ncbi:oligosaccharide flippase family protein [Tundrisphaera lichenicola]|uniref:oligosaccharide flippase family protein n=1 Tax=Tundrisphaera lichenicola TaxID=2029860 RepID=UPI003EBBD1EC